MLNYNNLKVLYIDDVYAIKDLYKKDIIECLKDNEEETSEENILSQADSIMDYLYDDMLTLINTYDYKTNYDYILIEGFLGLWNGRRKIKARFKTLKDAIHTGSCDYNIVYFKNERETLAKDSSHHDGCNSYKYYKVIKGKKYAIKYNDIVNTAL